MKVQVKRWMPKRGGARGEMINTLLANSAKCAIKEISDGQEFAVTIKKNEFVADVDDFNGFQSDHPKYANKGGIYKFVVEEQYDIMVDGKSTHPVYFQEAKGDVFTFKKKN